MIDRARWFVEARYGLFIHWGIWSLPGRQVYEETRSVRELELLAQKFNPKRYNPEEWVELAQEAGMRYMVLTTRHHDGFCLFDSKVSEFTAPKTRAKRDLVAEFVDACRSKDMKIGFYYSLLDVRYPAYSSGPEKDPEGWSEFLEYVHAQVRELFTNYGKIDILFYDGVWPWDADAWQSAKLNAMVRNLQPQILINNRSGLPEDYDTPEQRIIAPLDPERLWECNMTMDWDRWFYHPGPKKWLSTKQIIHNLVLCARGGGNYLLNVGPKPDGTFPRLAVKRLKKVGRWLKVNGESIYGTELCPFRGGRIGFTTAKGNTVYLHVTCWPGKEASIIGVRNRVLSAHLLATGQRVDVHQGMSFGGVHTEVYQVLLRGLPEKPPDPYDTVIAMEMDGKPQSWF